MIEVRHLSHSFGPHWALKDCSFRLKKGDFLFLSGPSGAGKTTLLRLLFAGWPIQRGEVGVAGFNLNRIKASQVPLLRRQVSVVFQDFKILPERTVYENVILPLQVRGMGKVHSDRRVRAVVRALGLDKRMDILCGELSGGEQQRVAVARAFVVNPQVLLADEPTGNLDQELSFRLMDLFKQFQAYGTTMIVATHSHELMRRHPEARIIRLEEGMITSASWPGAVPYPGFESGRSSDQRLLGEQRLSGDQRISGERRHAGDRCLAPRDFGGQDRRRNGEDRRAPGPEGHSQAHQLRNPFK